MAKKVLGKKAGKVSQPRTRDKKEDKGSQEKQSKEKQQDVKKQAAQIQARKPRRAANPRCILVWGPSDAGKTLFYISMFYAFFNKNPEAKLWALVNDGGFDETLNLFPEELDDNINLFEPGNMEEHLQAKEQVLKRAKLDDVVAIDHMQTVWDDAQNWYAKEVLGEDTIQLYYKTMRELYREQGVRDKKSGQIKEPRLDGWKDWPVIKNFHNELFIDPLTEKRPCNVIAASPSEPIDTDDAKEAKFWPNTLVDLKCRPGGEKRNYYRFSTSVYLTRADERYFMRITKNRGLNRVLKPVDITVNSVGLKPANNPFLKMQELEKL